jgi:hypothetical protein
MSDETAVIPLHGGEPKPEPERRSASRRRLRRYTFVRFIVRPHYQGYQVLLGDISPWGLSLLHHAPLEPGTVIALQVRGSLRGMSLVRTARVAHAVPYRGGWRIGCRVSPPFSEEELAGL